MASDFRTVRTLDELDSESRYLVHKAKEALESAYAPYSKFCVAAAVLLEDGTVVTGTNQENASYPAGMCAERVALFAAAALHPGQRIVRLAVTARKKAGKDLVPATSCGFCRQVMIEFEQRQRKPMEVIMMEEGHHWVTASSALALMPYAFTKSNLGGGK